MLRLAGEGRWWFLDKTNAKDWILFLWFCKHAEPTEATELKHFHRCFAEWYYSVYKSRPKPEFKADPAAVFEIEASVLRRQPACLHAPEQSFQQIVKIAGLILFRETPDDAKQIHGQAVKDLEVLQREPLFIQEMPEKILETKDRLVVACWKYLGWYGS